MLWEPTAIVALCPETCAGGYPRVADVVPSHPPQGLELPVIRPEVTHGLRHPGRCLSCGTLCKAPMPAAPVSGYEPRLTGCIGELVGRVGASRSAVPALGASVWGIPLRQGALQQRVERVSEASGPHYTASGAVARTAGGHDIDETSWLLHGDRQGLGGMANPAVASF